jgi:hypothetical protein
MGEIGDKWITLPGFMSDLCDFNRVRYTLEGINGSPVLANLLFIVGLISFAFARHANSTCTLCYRGQDHCRAVCGFTFHFDDHRAPYTDRVATG